MSEICIGILKSVFCVWKLAPQTDLHILCIASVGIIKKKDLLLHIEYHRYIQDFFC